MRVLQISEGFVGAQKDIELSIHKYLKAHGHKSIILYAVGAVSSDAVDIIPFEKRPDNIIRRALWKYAGHDDRYSYIQTRRIIQEIKQFEPDIVHIHVIHHGFVNFKMLMDFLSRRKIKIVYTLHDLWAVTGGCYHYTDVNCTGYLRRCADCTRNKQELDCCPQKTGKAFMMKHQKFSESETIQFVAVSDWLKREADHGFGHKFPITTIYNGVPRVEESEILKKNHHPLVEKLIAERAGRTVIVGCAASWTTGKGIERFFELAKLLGSEYWIILAGDVSEEIMGQSPTNITYLGYISDRALMWNIYRHADFHVSMSVEETFGMTFVEAAMNGIRSLGFNSTAIPEIITAVHGIVVDTGNIQAMAHEIKRHSKHSVTKLNGTEISEINRTFSEETMASRYCEIYSELICSDLKK